MKDYHVLRIYRFVVTYARSYFLAVMSVKIHVIMVIVNLAPYVYAPNVAVEAQNMKVFALKWLARLVNHQFAIKFVEAIGIVEDTNVILDVVLPRISLNHLRNGSIYKMMTMMRIIVVL